MRDDPHSYADVSQGRIERAEIHWNVDFEARRLRGEVRLLLDEAATGPLDLDTRDLDVESVEADGASLSFQLGERHPFMGQRLRIERDRPVKELRISYATTPEASGLMWLKPEQTTGGDHPFLLSQCQAIHARSLVPIQDTPRVRVTYGAEVTVPTAMGAVMSAGPAEEIARTDDGKTLRFEMPQPIPPYLLAIAVGDIASKDIGARTRVYAEPGELEAVAWEFAEAEQMLEAAEKLFGPYRWERYDFIVLPPAFPYGGMENPRMTFLTPTLVAGDRSLVSVLAHELAHSWTGNLVTNASNQDFWLNEGFTVYAERRLIEALYGPADATLHARLGRVDLEEVLAERQAQGRPTSLWYDQTDLDPDGEFSRVPYEKGFLFVTALERAVGREAFDVFLQHYIERFAFKSLDTQGFEAFVREALPDAKIDLKTWLYGDGLPDDAPEFPSPRLQELGDLARSWQPGQPLNSADWNATEAMLFLQTLGPLDVEGTEALAKALGLRETRNAELQCLWLSRAIEAGVEGIEDDVKAFVARIGRTKLLRPVFAALGERDDQKAFAQELVETLEPRWHVATRRAVRQVVGLS